MFSSRSAAFSGLLGLLLVGAVPAAAVLPAPAPSVVPSTASGDRVLIRENDVITEDLYSSGNSVLVRGRIQGDLVATAFESVVVEGVVEGDVIALTPRIDISGRVDGSVRGVADRLEVSGEVGDDVLAAARVVEVTGTVGRDVLSFGYRLGQAGSIGRDLRVQIIDVARLAGTVVGDAEINAGRLVVTDGAMVGGDLRYRAQASIGEVDVGGVTVELGKVPTPIRVQTLLLLTGALSVLAAVAMIVLVMWLAPASLRQAASAVSGWRWVTALGTGLAVVLLPAVAFVGLVAVAASSSPDFVLVVVVVLLPFAAVWLAVLAASLVGGVVPVAMAVGRGLIPSASVFLHVLLGVVLLGVAFLVPVVGPFVAAGTWLTGVGAWTRGAWRARGPAVWRAHEAPHSS